MATDASFREPAGRVRILPIPYLGQLAGVFMPEPGVIGVADTGSPCSRASALAHELTHVRRLGLGADSPMVRPPQSTAEDCVAFMLIEEAEAFIAQAEVARRLGCVAETEPALRAFAERIAGRTHDESVRLFLDT